MDSEIVNAPVTKANILRFIERYWNTLQDYIGTLSEAQLTQRRTPQAGQRKIT